MTFLALVTVYFFYKNVNIDGEGKTFNEVWEGFVRVVSNYRLLLLIIIVTGFWIIQHQLYATMPKYVLRTVGEHASPEWIANVNPFVVMISVVFITNMMRKVRAVTSMSVGMFLMPISALLMASSPILESITGAKRFYLRYFFSSSNYNNDDTRNYCSGFGGVFYISTLSGIFFTSSAKG